MGGDSCGVNSPFGIAHLTTIFLTRAIQGNTIPIATPLTPLIGTAHQRGLFFAFSRMSTPLNPGTPGPPTSPGEQIARLMSRGILIQDYDAALLLLSNVSFYRLRGYLEPFVHQTTDAELRPFQIGTSIEAVVERYKFDTRLRVMLLEAFSHIEISLRTQWTHCLAYVHGGGELSHLNPDLFGSQHGENLTSLKDDHEKRGKHFHHYDFDNCPIWAISEVMSFGQLSRWYRSTIPSVRQLVAEHYQLDQRVLRSLLRHLEIVRNFCAHHGLLWDREFITKFSLPRRMGSFPNPRKFFNEAETGKLYNSLVMVAYLARVITGNLDWTHDLIALMERYPNIPQDRMGFAIGWRDLEIWQTGSSG